jgi:ribonuclease J
MTFGDIEVTPLLCDHSAFDSYMLLITCDGKRALYTGDFRSNGRKSYSTLLRKIEKVDVLIVEGTTLSRSSTHTDTEHDLEEIAVRTINDTRGSVFILMAATNIDRLVTVYRAARRTGRLLLTDVYTAEIASAAGNGIPNPKDFSHIRVFLTTPSEKQYKMLCDYGNKKIGRSEIIKQRFIMCVRPSMQRYLVRMAEQLPFENSVLFYSMWDGYAAKDDMASFLHFMKEKGVRIVPLHTSGHADADTIEKLIEKARPCKIIPVHTENAEWFERYSDIDIIHESHCIIV